MLPDVLKSIIVSFLFPLQGFVHKGHLSIYGFNRVNDLFNRAVE